MAFIMVGCVGLIMSLTTMDIGKSLRDATHEEGEMTRATIREATHEEGEMTRATIREAMTALGERMDERDRRMDERMDERDRRMDERLDRMSASIEAMSADNRAFFRQMLEAQNRILEKVS